jgi:hypothetical protein
MANSPESTPRHFPSLQLLFRVMDELDALPSLRLTMPQAMRLWGLDRPTCEAVLETLIDAHFLQRDEWGQFVRTTRRRAGGDHHAAGQRRG